MKPSFLCASQLLAVTRIQEGQIAFLHKIPVGEHYGLIRFP